MNAKNKKLGFTLVEVLIVVVIMAVLAATIIPQFTDSTKDAKISTAKFNLHTLRAQIQLYKSQHAALPSADLSELTTKTNGAGTKMPTTGSPDPADYPFGPYLREIPDNPFVTGANTNVVGAAATNPPTAVIANAGWQYHAASGEIFINETDLLSE